MQDKRPFLGEAQISSVFRLDMQARVKRISGFVFVCFIRVWFTSGTLVPSRRLFFFLRAALIKKRKNHRIVHTGKAQ